MGKTTQHKKHSFLKTKWGSFAVKFGKGPQKINKAMSRLVEAERSVIRSVIGAKSVHKELNREGCNGLGEDGFARVPEDHVQQEKREKAISHIEILLEQISQLQDEVDNILQTEASLEREIVNLVATNKPARKSKGRMQRKTKYDNGHQVNHRKVRKKLCLKCKKQKARSDFHKDRSCKEGLARWCKACKAKAGKKYRKKQTAMRN